MPTITVELSEKEFANLKALAERRTTSIESVVRLMASTVVLGDQTDSPERAYTKYLQKLIEQKRAELCDDTIANTVSVGNTDSEPPKKRKRALPVPQRTTPRKR